jgi:hypothetical protein
MREQVASPDKGSRTIEVSVFRDGECIARVPVDTEEEAAEIVDAWSEQDGVRCLVDDLSLRHGLGDIPGRAAPEFQLELQEYRPRSGPP